MSRGINIVTQFLASLFGNNNLNISVRYAEISYEKRRKGNNGQK